MLQQQQRQQSTTRKQPYSFFEDVPPQQQHWRRSFQEEKCSVTRKHRRPEAATVQEEEGWQSSKAAAAAGARSYERRSSGSKEGDSLLHSYYCIRVCNWFQGRGEFHQHESTFIQHAAAVQRRSFTSPVATAVLRSSRSAGAAAAGEHVFAILTLDAVVTESSAVGRSHSGLLMGSSSRERRSSSSGV